MGKAPAVIIIARHGARLDAEDKHWVSTSATPYDTPLTYGGWTQTRALGARIASLLHARELACNGPPDDDPLKRRSSDTSTYSASSNASNKRKKQRVVIHSSPFLRCIQSSIAISAGMAQYKGNLQKFEALDVAAQVNRPKLFQSYRSQGSSAQDVKAPHSSGRPDSSRSEKAQMAEESMPDIFKPTLRVDAFLGEWLSNDYFQDITPPPGSNAMLENSKSDLMRPADSIQGARMDTAEGTSKVPPRTTGDVDSGVPNSASTNNEPVPAFSKSSSSTISPEKPRRLASKYPESIASRSAAFPGYAPPTPLYAIAPGEPIPTGYVAHARDTCINIDFPWDSMQSPQSWGDGGELNEEWSSMHTRFRFGIKHMIEWYKSKGAGFDPQSGDDDETRGADDDSEVILILVTHGAGCNALIGALTNQPVLLDVGMASLTMAVRKSTDPQQTNMSPTQSPAMNVHSTSPHASFRRSSVDVGLSSEYDMRLIASSEHLRAGADPLKIPQLSASTMPGASSNQDSRRGSSSSVVTLPTELDRPRPKNSSLGSIRRSNVKSLSSRSYTISAPRTQSGSGLWGNQRTSSTSIGLEESPPSPTSILLPEFSNAATPTSPAPTGGSGMWGSNGQPEVVRRGTSGLWGQSGPGNSSRRSTLSERA